jgi:hypothetical protein
MRGQTDFAARVPISCLQHLDRNPYYAPLVLSRKVELLKRRCRLRACEALPSAGARERLIEFLSLAIKQESLQAI